LRSGRVRKRPSTLRANGQRCKNDNSNGSHLVLLPSFRFLVTSGLSDPFGRAPFTVQLERPNAGITSERLIFWQDEPTSQLPFSRPH
jgi:hypothetical protein